MTASSRSRFSPRSTGGAVRSMRSSRSARNVLRRPADAAVGRCDGFLHHNRLVSVEHALAAAFSRCTMPRRAQEPA